MIDFEEALKKYGPDFHGKHGFPGVMGDLPKKPEGASKEKAEDPIHKILKYQQEQAKKSAESPKMMKTGEGGQVVLEVSTDAQTGHPKTPAAERTPSSDAEPIPSVTPREEATPSVRSNPSTSPTPETAEGIPVEEEVVSTTVEDQHLEQTIVTKSEVAQEESEAAHVKDEL